MGNRSSQSEQSVQSAAMSDQKVPLELCGMNNCGFIWVWHWFEPASRFGGALDPKTFQVSGASGPKGLDVRMEDPECTQKEESSASTAGVIVPAPPSLTPEMKDELAVTTGLRALSPRIVAVHGRMGTGKSTMFPLAVAHGTYTKANMISGLTICAQPRIILARELCKRVRKNRRMCSANKTVGY